EADDALVPLVGGDVVARGLQRELVGRGEMVERSAAAADRAIALHRLGRRPLVDTVGDLAAMAASLEGHRRPSSREKTAKSGPSSVFPSILSAGRSHRLDTEPSR